MIQLIILAIAVAALIGGIAEVYHKGGDSREASLRVELQAEKDRMTKQLQEHEKGMRDYALTLSKGYLDFLNKQDKQFGAQRETLIGEIRKNPSLQLVCGDPDWVRRFNATGSTGQQPGGAEPAPSSSNAVVPKPAAPAVKGNNGKRRFYNGGSPAVETKR